MSAMCLAVIVLVALAAAPVTSVSHNDAVHMGCFKTNLVDTQRSYYMVNEPLSWENGISACIRRYTTHVGVQAHNSSPSTSYFFCGNDLLEHSDRLEDSACARCASPTDRYCGGTQSISLYKIRDSTPLVILVATAKRIKLLEEDEFHTHYLSLIQTTYYIKKIINFYSRDELVLQGNHDFKLYKSFFDHQIQEYRTPTVEVNSDKRGLAVDWLNEKIYYCEQHWIMEYDLASKTTGIAYKIKSSECYDLAVDPYTRTLFTVFNNGTLSAFSLLTQSYRTYTEGKYGQYYAKEVAVDCESQLIYVITQLTADLNTTYLVHLDYNLDNLTILHNDTELSNTDGLDVFNGTVIWAEYSRSTRKRSIYSCKPSPTCNHENMKPVHNITDLVSDISIYHPVKQTPTERYLCETAGCSHGCSKRTLFTTRCTCPEGLTLDSDNATCQEVPRTESMIEITTEDTKIQASKDVSTMDLSPDSKSSTSTNEVPRTESMIEITTEDTKIQASKDVSTMDLSPDSKSSTSTNESSRFTMATMSSSADSSKTSSTSAPTSSNLGPKINLLITYSVVGLVLVSLLFVTVIASFLYLFRYYNSA